MIRLLLSILALHITLAGCAHVMSDTSLALADRSIGYAMIKKNPEALTGKTVLLGGVITGTRSSGDLMQLEIAQLPLLDNGVPDEYSPSQGRFLLISGELLDPAHYPPGMFITVIGEIRGQRIQKLVGVDYRYPLVSAREIKLFQPLEAAPEQPDNPYQNRVNGTKPLPRPAAADLAAPQKR
jgi:outer membrane lipoprotein